MAKYSKKAQELIRRIMRRKKSGKLYSGSGEKVTDNKQAVAIAISEAREKGLKVPPEKKAKKK
ncbi:hypothetical protein GCM10023091_35990 [Ravibacter arvi]|uniref:Histone H1 n=1 Tax=Ravibacter arvi TaxID=2051041 RepID=A0ABP8M7X7_9BACT